jgi:serine/threonine-protein kinase
MTAGPCGHCGLPHDANVPCGSRGGRRVGLVLDGKYAIARLLGEGGMGEVYEARHTKLGRRVAVKFLFAEYARKPAVARRFETEAMTAGSLEHENVGAVYDVGALPDGTPYLVMEFLVGEDVDRLLQRETRLTLARAADIVIQACHGLDEVHRRGIVHRDLKPANLFLLRRPNGADLVKIIDFGIAKLRTDQAPLEATKTGAAIGTPYYMSPEQGRGEKNITSASDLYSLGVILYELLAGARPHEGSSPFEIVHKILTEAPPPLEQLAPDLPPPVYPIVRKALSREPADRFASANELAMALGPFVTMAPGAIAPPAYAIAATPVEGQAVRVAASTLTAADLPLTMPATTATRPRGSRVALGVLGGLGVLVLACGAVAMLAVRTSHGGAAAAAPVAASIPMVVASAAPSAPVAAFPVAAAPVPQPSADTESSTGGGGAPTISPTTPAAEPRASTTPRVGPAASAKRAAPPPQSKPDCTQKYTVDRDGNRHFRPECFGNQ